MITEDSRVRAPRIIRDQETRGRAGPDGEASETGGMNETGVTLGRQSGPDNFMIVEGRGASEAVAQLVILNSQAPGTRRFGQLIHICGVG